MNKKTIEDLNVSGKTVLVRVDFNVPQDENGNVADGTRIREALPTIKYLVKNEAKVILVSHLGRPKGFDKKFTLKPIANKLQEYLGNEINVSFSASVVGEETAKKVKALKSGEILLIENIRFEAGEEKNDPELSKKLASLCDIYVNDAFGTAHRAHASTYGAAELAKESAVGKLMGKELTIFNSVLDDNYLDENRPVVVIMGGAKVSDKIEVIENLIKKLEVGDSLIIGGSMASTFIKAMGGEVGKSRVEDDKLDVAMKLIGMAERKGVNIVLPIDSKCVLHEYIKEIVTTHTLPKGVEIQQMDSFDILPSYSIVDIGDKTIKKFTQIIKEAKVVIWNGPVGIFEVPEMAIGTNEIAKTLTKVNGITVVGGGDSVAAINALGSEYAKKISHISTGGGASLELLAGKELPGVTIIKNRDSNPRD